MGLWEVSDFRPEIYAIYGSDAPISILSQGELVGRLFAYEYFPCVRRAQVAPADAGEQGGRLEYLVGRSNPQYLISALEEP